MLLTETRKHDPCGTQAPQKNEWDVIRIRAQIIANRKEEYKVKKLIVFVLMKTNVGVKMFANMSHVII